jgi:transcriptional regulator with XRE-family HTH domain
MSKQSLGRLVQRTRQSRQLSQYALSKAAGISVPYVQRLENGEYDTFPPQYLENVAQVLGLSVDTLSQELEKPDGSQAGVGVQVVPKAELAEISRSAQPPSPSGPVDLSGDDLPLLSLHPPVNPEHLMADIALLSDEDQKRVADFVQSLLKGESE